MEQLSDMRTIIAELGGGVAVAQMTGRKTDHAPSNWIARGNFPADTHHVMTEALRAKGKIAPASLWGQTETPPREKVGG